MSARDAKGPAASDGGAAPPAEPSPHGELINLQALRALAVFLVVFVHLQALAVIAGAPARLLQFGNAGVDLFFVISGFIMVFTTSRRPTGPLSFLVNRLRRIAPLYWCVTLLLFGLAAAAPGLMQGTQADPRQLAASLAFLPFRRGDGEVRPVVFVGWTLNYEMAFYGVFALGLSLRRRLAGVGLTVCLLLAAVIWGGLQRPPGLIAAFYTAPIILEFGLGMLIALAWPRTPNGHGVAGAFAAAGLLAVAVIVAAPRLWPSGERAMIFGLPAAVIVCAALVLEHNGLILRWPWVRKLGDASYSIYLSHPFVTQLILLAAVRLHARGPVAAAAVGALALVAVAAAGLAAHAIIEQGLERGLRIVSAGLSARGRRPARRSAIESEDYKRIV